jgi:hypothetical protein
MKKLLENTLIRRALKTVIWIIGLVLCLSFNEWQGFSIDNEPYWSITGTTLMLTICIVLWVNQRLTIKPDYEEDKYFLTKGIVLFSIPTAAMLISNGLGLDMVYTALIFYPISFFVTWKLSQFLAKKEGN